MPNAIKDLFNSAQALTITLASLGSSTSQVGRQSTLVDNTSDRFGLIHLYVKVTTGTSPVAGRFIYVHLISSEATSSPNVITDGAGASDAGLTIVSAIPLGTLGPITSTTNAVYQDRFIIRDPGPRWGIAIWHDTNVNLNSTGGNHGVWWVGKNPEIQ